MSVTTTKANVISGKILKYDYETEALMFLHFDILLKIIKYLPL